MWLSSHLKNWRRLASDSRRRRPRRGRPDYGPPVEALECRTLLTAYAAATAAQLVADINAANTNGGTNTITLTAPMTSPYILTGVNNTADGPNGLPQIAKKDNLTIIGNGDTIERSTAAGTPAFRLFDVASGASLTLQNITLQNGFAQGAGAAADGGAIYNQGSLTLIGAILQDNAAEGTNGASGLVTSGTSTRIPKSINGQAGGNAVGGAIWSSGSVTLEGGTILQNNEALGGQGGAAGAYFTPLGSFAGSGGAGGSGFGGGLYEAGGSVNIVSASLVGNTGAGGTGGAGFETTGWNWVNRSVPSGLGGTGAGGGLYVAAGTLNATTLLVQANQALGGTGGATNDGSTDGSVEVPGNGGVAYGGGIDIAGGTATLAGSKLFSNKANGGAGGSVPATSINSHTGTGGNAYGGGLYAGGGTSTLNNDMVTNNEAIGGGTIPFTGQGNGGGIEIAAAAIVSLDSITVSNTINNYIFNAYAGTISNIDGKYTLL
jgi:hypothetical protein